MWKKLCCNFFSVRTENYIKIITILGFKIKFKQKYLLLENKISELEKEILNSSLEHKKEVFLCSEKMIRTKEDILDQFNYLQNRNNENFKLTLTLLIENFLKNNKINYSINKLINNSKKIACSSWSNKVFEMLENLNYLFSSENKLNFIEKEDNIADLYFLWGTQSYFGQLNTIKNALFSNKPVLIAEGGFLNSIETQACKQEYNKYHKGISFVFDVSTMYYDARNISTLEKMLNDKNLIITDEQKSRARKCINKIIENHLTKYNQQPIFKPQIGRKNAKKVLVVDQSYGDMSILKGLATDETFNLMLKAAIEDNPDADIIVKTHPDTMAGAGGYYKNLIPHDNIYTLTEPINPISLIKYVDKVYVCTTQFGFEALMCNKEVYTFGMPFYAGWGLTNDYLKNERRTNKRTLEEIFYITYIMYSYYVNPDKKSRCEIEEAMDYLLNLRKEYFIEKNIKVENEKVY